MTAAVPVHQVTALYRPSEREDGPANPISRLARFIYSTRRQFWPVR